MKLFWLIAVLTTVMIGAGLLNALYLVGARR